MNKKMIVALLLASSGLACSFMIQGRAEMVKRNKGGGVLALKGDRDKAMEDAKGQMASNCPDGYEVVGEEMVKVGEATESDEDVSVDKKNASKSGSSVTTEVKEYRITYECKNSEVQTAGVDEEETAPASEGESASPEDAESAAK
ncbi:MAG TPA: hypothetical protein VIM73_07850 [Polyangiaceae bacterium]